MRDVLTGFIFIPLVFRPHYSSERNIQGCMVPSINGCKFMRYDECAMIF